MAAKFALRIKVKVRFKLYCPDCKTVILAIKTEKRDNLFFVIVIDSRKDCIETVGKTTGSDLVNQFKSGS